MVGAVARKEFLEKLISFRFFLAVVLCVVLLPGIVYVRCRDYEARAQALPKVIESHRQAVRVLPREWSWTLFGCVIDRPLNPLSVLVDPVDLRDGGEVELRWLDVPAYVPTDESNPVPDFFLAFHPLSFITVVMSLLAVVFSFDAVCGEKSQGTLKLMLAAGVPRGTLLAGKWLGGLAAVALPFLLGVLVSALVVLVVLSGSLSASHWVAMGAILLLSLLFLSVVYSAGMLVSSLTAEPATSAACLLLLWALAFLGYPNLAPVLASWLRPTPTPAESRKEQRSQLDEVRKTTEALFAQFEKEWEPRKDDPQSRNDYWVEKRKFYVEQEKLMGPALEKFHESQARVLEAQVELTNGILRAAPLGSYMLAFDELAGTGSSERSRLLSAVTRYQTRFFVYFAGRSVQMVEKRKALGITDMPPYSTGDFPLFGYQESTVLQRSSRSLFDVVLLAAWNVLLFVGAYASFLRYDVS